jgi:two-component system KDP operon response regulator KdpE
MKKILLADDDASIRKALGQVLASEQYHVIEAASGTETAAKFIGEQPDLVLLDLGMPDRDGWQVFDLMQSTHPAIPVIIITAKTHQYRRAADMGVTAIMEKPLDLPVLLEAIRDYLNAPKNGDPERPDRRDVKTILLGKSENKYH